MEFPKVLIIGETFRTNGGGGITMTNLFKGWPKDKIAVITEDLGESKADTCQVYYQIGHLEKKSFFPINLFSNIKMSRAVLLEQLPESNHLIVTNESKIRNLIKWIYQYSISILGINHFINRLTLSPELIQWIKEYNPDIIYAQTFSYREMQFVFDLSQITKYQYVLHIMDDSIGFQNKPNLLYSYWRKRINLTFLNLVRNSKSLFTISEAMGQEYKKRYGKDSVSFRNPIVLKEWLPHTKINFEIENIVKVIYTGRIAEPNIHSLYLFCKSINQLNVKEVRVSLDIYSLDNNPKFKKSINSFKGININKSVSYNEMPKLISKYDIALLPIDFTKQGIKYAKYSISTKTSEYMISGVPIFLLAPETIALSLYAKKHSCMFCVANNDYNVISKELTRFINNLELRKIISYNSIKVCKEESDDIIVRENFRNSLLSE
jgi:glycosyltransferase involved in cell wall biosynthesis